MKKIFLLTIFFLPEILFSQQILFQENFDDANIKSRGWYDNTTPKFSSAEKYFGAQSLEFFFAKGAKIAVNGGALRRKFSPSESVYLSYWVKYSESWTGSNKPYHPHEFHFTTNEDPDYVGPAATHLTLYIEQNEGTPMLAIQDAKNIDAAKIGVDLTNITENRAVSGCNGNTDGTGNPDCYKSGTEYRNGKSWKAGNIFFSDAPGKFYKSDWHHVEAFFKLNSIVNGKGIPDGQVKYWFDDSILIDHEKILLRTGQFPNMKFQQFLIAPYIGDGSPVDQTMWVDEVTVATERIAPKIDFSGPNPNPFYNSTKFTFSLIKQEKVNISVFDNTGKAIETLVDAIYSAGEHEIYYYAKNLPEGVFLFKMTAGNYQIVRSGLHLDTNSTSVPAEKFSSGRLSLSISPEPVSESGKISFSLEKKNSLSVKILDILGNEILTLMEKEFDEGNYSLDFSTENFSSGIFFVRVQSGNESQTKSFQVLQ